eukprot:2730-Pyramimonas_sp.AAC.1
MALSSSSGSVRAAQRSLSDPSPPGASPPRCFLTLSRCQGTAAKPSCDTPLHRGIDLDSGTCLSCSSAPASAGAFASVFLLRMCVAPPQQYLKRLDSLSGGMDSATPSSQLDMSA